MGDGSCFFHAYLRATNFKYRHMAPSERQEEVRKLREDVAAHVSLESLKEVSFGEQRRMLFFGALRHLLHKHAPIADVQLPALVEILEKATTFKENFYMTFMEEALRRDELAAAPVAQKQRFVNTIKEMFHAANELAIDSYKHQILTDEIGSNQIEFIARFLKCNFLFLYETKNGIERYPFSMVIDDSWSYCVFLWVQESHYEVIGKKEPNSVVNRVFYRDDEIVIHFTAGAAAEVVEDGAPAAN
jgi:hypothetical protein